MTKRPHISRILMEGKIAASISLSWQLWRQQYTQRHIAPRAPPFYFRNPLNNLQTVHPTSYDPYFFSPSGGAHGCFRVPSPEFVGRSSVYVVPVACRNGD